MDLSKCISGIKLRFEKYKYVLVVILAGVLLMLLPEKNESILKEDQTQDLPQTMTTDIASELEAILSHVSGAGEVKVMVSTAYGEETIFQTDTTSTTRENESDIKIQTILISDSERKEAGLVRQVNPPIYQGVIVIANGGDDPVIKLAIVDAVSKVTGLGADRISVLKMK